MNNWNNTENEIAKMIPQNIKVRIMDAICKNESEESVDIVQKDVTGNIKSCFAYAVFKDCVCYGKYVDGKLSEGLVSNNINKLLELRVFNEFFEVRVIYSFEKDKLLYRYLDDYDESGELFIYKEEHYLDGEWKNGRFQNDIRSCPKLPFNESKYSGKELKMRINSHIRFDDDNGFPEIKDWRLAGFTDGYKIIGGDE